MFAVEIYATIHHQTDQCSASYPASDSIVGNHQVEKPAVIVVVGRGSKAVGRSGPAKSGGGGPIFIAAASCVPRFSLGWPPGSPCALSIEGTDRPETTPHLRRRASTAAAPERKSCRNLQFETAIGGRKESGCLYIRERRMQNGDPTYGIDTYRAMARPDCGRGVSARDRAVCRRCRRLTARHSPR